LIFEFELPFSIGQEISISKLGIEGKVQDIGWRMIKVITKDGHLVMIPNSVFINETVILRYVKL
jgi:small-conductance mechanosensitive channel